MASFQASTTRVSQISEPSNLSALQGDAIPAVIVSAGGLLSLDVARTLSKRRVDVIGVFTGGPLESIFSPAVRSSRYLHPYFAPAHQLVEHLMALGERLGRPSVLIPLGDTEMLAISLAREKLAQWYRLRLPPHATIEMLLNKDAFAQEAMKHGLPVPVSIAVAGVNELEPAAKSINYPCIIKPPWRDERWQELHGTDKVCLARSPEELLNLGAGVLALCGRCLIQNIVPGPETNLVCTFAFVDDSSDRTSVVTCRKIRQFPAHFGNTAMAETASDPEAEELTMAVCRKLGLVGYVSIEFKRDPVTGRLLILEITPGRVNRQIGVTDVAGRSIVMEWYRKLSQLPTEPVPPLRLGLRWVSLANDLRAFPNYRRSAEWSLGEWWRSYAKVRRSDFSIQDPLPILASFGIMARRLFRPRSNSNGVGSSLK